MDQAMDHSPSTQNTEAAEQPAAEPTAQAETVTEKTEPVAETTNEPTNEANLSGQGDQAAQFPKKEDEGGLAGALQSIPTRQYLDQTVVPILLLALGALAKERPADPIDFLANYLLKEKSRFVSAQGQQANNN
ncbi:hypothetical protein M3Y97_00126800 [Aphelenchoides bicaudatus]|nr:hypothetical protein M3Y97_00126800 [Aphelenchoides bicaudatus]